MGWLLKIGLFIVALVAADFGAWVITAPIILLLFLPPVLDRKGKRKGGQDELSGGGKGTSVLSIIGAILVFLGAVAFFGGGTFSPIVLAGCGFALLLRKKVSLSVPTRVKPVADSILLRHKFAPYRWSALAEAKVSTRDPEGALSGLSERLFFTSDPKPRIFLSFTTSSLRRAKAEEALIMRMQASARTLVALGVYLLPLDGAEAAEIAAVRAHRIEPPTNSVLQNVSTADYGSVIVEAQNGFVKRLEMYSHQDEDMRASSILSPLNTATKGQLTLRELLRGVRVKLGAPQPDRYSAFLSSIAATEGEAFGQRITETVQGGQEQVLLVTSVGNPSVELSRAQLQAIMKIYE